MFEGIRLPKDRPWSRRPQVISQEDIEKPFETTHARKWQNWHRRRKSPLYPRWSKRLEEEVWDALGNPCWVQQWFRSVWRGVLVCWMTWRCTGIESFFFQQEKFYGISLRNVKDRVVTIGNDVSEHHRVSTTKHLASIKMLGFVASNWKMLPVWFDRGYRLISVV